MPCSPRLANSILAASVAGAYVRKAACHRTESGSSLLSVGGRKSREVETQPQGPKSVKAMLVTTAERHCPVCSGWRTRLASGVVSGAYARNKPITVQKATPRRSVAVEGRVVKPDYNHGPQRRCTRSPPPRPRGAAILTTDGEQRCGRRSGGCVRAESSLSSSRKRLPPAQYRRKEESQKRR